LAKNSWVQSPLEQHHKREKKRKKKATDIDRKMLVCVLIWYPPVITVKIFNKFFLL
jgi:hypothetical protein